MRRLVLLFVLLSYFAAASVADDKAATPPPPSPQPTVITYSAVELAQVEQYAADNRGKVKEAKRLLKRAATLQAELQKIQQRLQVLANSTAAIQKK